VHYARRIEALRSAFAERQLDVLLVGEPANREYLTGFGWKDESAGASSGWVVLTPRAGYFLTTFNYFAAVLPSLRHLEPVEVPPGKRMIEALGDLLAKQPGRRIGFESGWLTVAVHRRLTEATSNREWVAADGLVETLRQVKDAEELAVLQRSIAVTDQAFTEMIGWIRPGLTERQVAWQLERALRDLGAESMAFGPAVASGPNAAVPHHEPSDRVIEVGDPVWIDMGGRLGGYCADLTRSFVLEAADPGYLAQWKLVQQAEEAAIAALRPGMTGAAADDVARQVIAAAGHGPEFGHGLGHGVGLAIHEGPMVTRTSDDVLPVGAVVTIEPGIYRANWGGIRHEDVVVIEANGTRVLSQAPKAPVVAHGQLIW
jgi:Xaa-Pro aminopeptidase